MDYALCQQPCLPYIDCLDFACVRIESSSHLLVPRSSHSCLMHTSLSCLQGPRYGHECLLLSVAGLRCGCLEFYGATRRLRLLPCRGLQPSHKLHELTS